MGVAAETTAAERLLWRALVALSLLSMVGLSAMVALRIGYPFELEWMEGAMVDEAVRVRHGLATYSAPSMEHVPFLYTPLYYWLSAAAMSVLGEGFAAVRAVSVMSTAACLWLIAVMARRLASRPAAGVVAAGLFAAGYGWLRSWYDLGRNDMVFLAGMLGTSALLGGRGMRTAVAAGVVAALAFLAKQTALLWLPPLFLGAVVVDWRRGVAFGASGAVAVGGCMLACHLATDGWFTFYVFDMPKAHVTQPDRWVGFFTQDLVPIAPLVAITVAAVAANWRCGMRRHAAALALFCSSGMLASYLSRLHVGGFDNVLVYGFATVCVVGPWCAAKAGSSRARAVALLVLVAQFATLTIDVRAPVQTDRPALLYDPRRWLPRESHRLASQQLVEFLRAQDGPVLVPFHGHLPRLAGKAPSAHGQALNDLMAYVMAAAPDDRAALALDASCERTLGAGSYAAVVLERPFGVVFEQLFARYVAGYVPQAGSPVTVPTAIRPLVGMVTDSPFVLVPRH